MDSNSDEAQRALDEARIKIRNRDFVKALKLLNISKRLRPTEELLQLIANVEMSLRSDHPTEAETLPNPQGQTAQNDVGRERWLVKFWGNMYDALISWERRWIAPELKIYVRGIAGILLFIMTWKYVVKGKLSLFSLPGDLNYKSESVYISAPIVSCMLISFLLNAASRALQPTAR